ncbi:MAG: ATP-grasp domain-containing protein [Betaproteobacteria bacterium]|nr:ATP-grasp domain-containing protein [Betaproteobacteria bacterium]
MMRFETLLIANRGEIALRVMRSARRLGLRCVAVYSDADRDAPHVRAADAAVWIGPAAVAESYLSIARILDACRRTAAQAVHPGYGFLSENPHFARACREAGIVFVGPPAEAIVAMANKSAAKRRMQAAGVACIPGYCGEDQSDARLAGEAGSIGYPLMIKAADGGGGRGMRRVASRDAFQAALTSARTESEQAFGSREVLLERALEQARHVEVQVLADAHGHVVHLGERDCSVQRRHQKVIEECPSPAVDAKLRHRLGELAVTAARAIGYIGAGTVECLLDPGGECFFMEMNTRLQVEHPVTEMVTGLDLVELQLRIAQGEALPFAQEDVEMRGHAIEARLYAEDPEQDFLPQTGTVALWRVPQRVRVDAGIVQGAQVTPYYDPMLAKIVAHGATRNEARHRLIAALRETCALGVVTNRDFLIACLAHPEFAAGSAGTGFIEGSRAALSPPAPLEGDFLRAALIYYAEGPRAVPGMQLPVGALTQAVEIECDGMRRKLQVRRDREALWIASEKGEPVSAAIRGRELEIGGVSVAFDCAWTEELLWLQAGGPMRRFREVTLAPGISASAGEALVRSPLAGRVSAVLARPGEVVKRGQSVVVIESMKMENHVAAGVSGVVEEILVHVGMQVAPGARLAVIGARQAVQA